MHGYLAEQTRIPAVLTTPLFEWDCSPMGGLSSDK